MTLTPRALLLAPLTLLLSSLAISAELDQRSDADRMVQQALQAEVDGDPSQRNSLLQKALHEEPDHPPARWHMGNVLIDGNWLPLSKAEEDAVAGSVVDSYRAMRDRYAGNPVGEVYLARWCRKNGMEEREKLHWTRVLSWNPTHKEARQRLGVREYRGQLLTKEQIAQWKAGIQTYQDALEQWQPQLQRWRREIENAPVPHLTEAWNELSGVTDVEALPALEKMFPRVSTSLQRKFVSVFGNMDDQLATDVLVRIALFADDAAIRDAAAVQLSERSWYGFVPNLLSRLETPVQYRYYLQTLGSAVISGVWLSSENEESIVNVSRTANETFPILVQERGVGNDQVLRVSVRQQRAVQQATARQYRTIVETLRSVEASNAQKMTINDRIFTALSTATNQSYHSDPRYWWDWWREYNELDDTVEKPEYAYHRDRHREKRFYVRKMSCFVAGTTVSTETGPRPIEQVRIGDRVLSQHPETGELSYQLVVDTTLRPASPTLRIRLGDEEIVATLGHPMWVVGQGWKMAKELAVGDRLHGVDGGVTIDAIEPGEIAEAHNLVVAENSTYFVGDQRVLAHDNMPRRAIVHPLPGWNEL